MGTLRSVLALPAAVVADTDRLQGLLGQVLDQLVEHPTGSAGAWTGRPPR
jgi:hypothetical protein